MAKKRAGKLDKASVKTRRDAELQRLISDARKALEKAEKALGLIKERHQK
jgi:hypothetical protein